MQFLKQLTSYNKNINFLKEQPKTPKNFGLYVHIPFCKKACHYCNFHFSTNLSLKDKMISSLEKELSIKKEIYPEIKISTIYFGGGTPSLLSSEDLYKVLNAIHKYFHVDKNIETTIEINPDDVSDLKLKEFKKLNFNRLSVGVQTFNDEVLKFINRSHDSKTAKDAFSIIEKNGFDNFNLDIIFGLPKSNIKILENDLKVIKKINPNHISIYCLSIEEKTVFKNWLDRGIINEASSERIIAEYKKICDFAKENSFFHYEVSNFSKKNKESKHNSNYWNHQNGYIGIGPSAHSYDFETRKSNISNNFKYVNAIDQNKIPETIEVLSLKNKTNEYIMTSLRTKKGCDFIFLKKKFEYDIFTEKKIIDLLIQKKYLYIKQNYIVLTELGMLLSDEITSKLFLK